MQSQSQRYVLKKKYFPLLFNTNLNLHSNIYGFIKEALTAIEITKYYVGRFSRSFFEIYRVGSDFLKKYPVYGVGLDILKKYHVFELNWIF